MELGCVDGCCDVTARDVVEAAMISSDESVVRTELDEVLENVAVDFEKSLGEMELFISEDDVDGVIDESSWVIEGAELDVVLENTVVALLGTDGEMELIPKYSVDGETEEGKCVVHGTELDAVLMEKLVAVVTSTDGELEFISENFAEDGSKDVNSNLDGSKLEALH